MRNRWKKWTVLICALAALIATICWLLRPSSTTYTTYTTSSFGPEDVKLRFRYPIGWEVESRTNNSPGQRYIVLRPSPRAPNAILDWIDLHLYHIDPAKQQNAISVNLVRTIPHRTVDDVARFMSQGMKGGTPTGEVRHGFCSLGTTLTIDHVYQRPPGMNDRIVNIFPRSESQAAHYHVIVWTHASQPSKDFIFRIGGEYLLNNPG